jgi:DNA-binding transcriptional ArsR family regulator
VAERSGFPDYSLEEVAVLSRPDEIRALTDVTRRKILTLLSARAASPTDLAEALALPKGTVAHHVKVLLDAGLVSVVRTRKVRALTERYYGRRARLFRIVADEEAPIKGGTIADLGAFQLRQAAAEIAPRAGEGDDPSLFLLVHRRLSERGARRFARRLESLAKQFADESEEAEPVYGFVAGIYRSEHPEPPRE